MKILQIGKEDWSSHAILPDELKWYHTKIEDLPQFLADLKAKRNKNLIDNETKPRKKKSVTFQAVLLTEEVSENRLDILDSMVEAHCVFIKQGLPIVYQSNMGFFRRKMIRHLPFSSPSRTFFSFMQQTMFSGQYGAKLKIPDIDIAPTYAGKFSYDGHVAVQFDGDFGEEFTPLYTYRYNLAHFDMALELWQEWEASENCDIAIEITRFYTGSLHDIKSIDLISGSSMFTPYILKSEEDEGYYSVSIFAKGQGTLRFGPLHWRYSRQSLGQLSLGGDRIVDEKGQELIIYFNPGDMKPPLNIYFSGYRQAEGFEGFVMMKAMTAPFILVADPRIEGGSFYTGTDDLEKKLVKSIQKSIDYLGFSQSDVILSGFSMGSFGALYYAASILPYAVIVGKPFASLGNTALGLKLTRPNEFETIGDVVKNLIGGTTLDDVEALSQKFWKQFKSADFSNTLFALGYMKNDDYDGTAAYELVDYLSAEGVHVYTKGYQGRHNDNGPVLVRWFLNQYQTILRDRFGRKF